MDRMLFISMSGAKEAMAGQAVQAHNLANVNTTGFKADLANFESLDLRGPGYPVRVYGQLEPTDTDYSHGTLQQTGRDLDVAVNGEGWIAIQAGNGTEAYTRAGDLKISPNGLLQNGAGYLVLGDAGPIAIPPAEKIEIGTDGSVSIQPKGQPEANLAVIDRVKLVRVDEAELVKGLDGLLRTKSDDTLPADARVTLAVGLLETSNVNSVEAMVNMIELARRFELNVKMMKTAETNDQAATRLMSIS